MKRVIYKTGEAAPPYLPPRPACGRSPVDALRDIAQPAIFAGPRLNRLSCSLTSCCDWSGESPDGGRFSVRPSSLTPSAVRQRATPEAGVTMSSEGVVKCNLTLLRRSQPGGLGKRAGRNHKENDAAPKWFNPSIIAGRDGVAVGDS